MSEIYSQRAEPLPGVLRPSQYTYRGLVRSAHTQYVLSQGEFFLDAGMNEQAQDRLTCPECPIRELCGAVVLGLLDTPAELGTCIPKRNVETLSTYGVDVSRNRWELCPSELIRRVGNATTSGLYSRGEDDPLINSTPRIVVVNNLRIGVNDIRTRLNKRLLK